MTSVIEGRVERGRIGFVMEKILAALGFYAWLGKAICPQMVVLIGTLVGIQLSLKALDWIADRMLKR
jgi:hypothetical protein